MIFHVDTMSLPTLLMHLASFALCGSLLQCIFPKVPAEYRQRLRLRQLKHLAVADSGAAAFALISVVANALVADFPEHGDLICNGVRDFVMPFGYLFLNASVMIEMHLAFGILFGESLRPLLGRALVWVWPVAAALMPIDVFVAWSLEPFDSPDNANQRCIWHNNLDPYNSAPALSTLALLAILVNFAAYVSIWVGLDNDLTPGSVTRRAWKQLWRYCVSVLVTWVPYWALFFYGCWKNPGHGDEFVSVHWVNSWSQMVTATAIASNGAANFWSYAAHNRQLRAIWRGDAESAAPHVAGQDIDNPLAHHVLFDPVVVEVHFVQSLLVASTTARSIVASSYDATSDAGTYPSSLQ